MFKLPHNCTHLTEMATHSSVLAWRTPGMAGPGGLPSMGWHRVGHDWSDLAAAAAAAHASKVMLKILQARLQQYVNHDIPDVQAGFRKGRGTRGQIANIHWLIEKARVPEKHLLLLYWLCQSLWLCGSQQTVENSERWCCESAALNMPANLENSAVATGLEKVSFYSNPKER